MVDGGWWINGNIICSEGKTRDDTCSTKVVMVQ